MEARAMNESTAQTLAEKLNYLRSVGATVDGVHTRYDFAQVSRETGVSRSMISQYCSGRLQINPEMENKLRSFADGILAKSEEGEDERDDARQIAASSPVFKTQIELYRTSEFIEAIGLLDWTMKNRKMLTMIGYPGIGKTTVLREYARREPGARIITCRPTMRMRDLIGAIADALGIVVSGSNDERVQRIMRTLKGRTGDMLIFDEADHLYVWDVKKFDVIRQIWDETGVPTVLAGPPRLEELLTRGGGRQNLSQLYRRKFEIRMSGIKLEEVRGILQDYDVEPDAARELAAIAMDARHGGMGNFVEIFGLCLDAAKGGRVTRAILEASKCYKLQG